MKKIYNAPSANSIYLESSDVITVSVATEGDGLTAGWEELEEIA